MFSMLNKVVVPIQCDEKLSVREGESNLLVGNNDVMLFEKGDNVLYEDRCGFLDMDIVTLGVPETEDMGQRHRDSGFSWKIRLMRMTDYI